MTIITRQSGRSFAGAESGRIGSWPIGLVVGESPYGATAPALRLIAMGFSSSTDETVPVCATVPSCFGWHTSERAQEGPRQHQGIIVRRSLQPTSATKSANSGRHQVRASMHVGTRSANTGTPMSRRRSRQRAAL
jgi:hypothetical protein